MLLSINSLLPLKRRFPSWKLSPHLKSRKVATAEGSRSDYVNSNGVITVALDKNYATILKTYDQNGNCILEQYFDNFGKPAILITGNSAICREFDSHGQWIKLTYLDSKLNPIINKRGYASVHRTFANEGKDITEMYYDTENMPTPDIYRRYGVCYEYNENGQIIVITSLDANRNAMNNSDHYSISKRTYTADKKIHTEMFYDKDGNPAKLSDGQYGYIYENGRPICLDQNGRKMFVLRHFLLHSAFAVLLIGTLLLFMIIRLTRRQTWILLLSYLAFILYMTIIDREVGVKIVTMSIPQNYYLFFTNREVMANIWLFIPLGAILYKLSPTRHMVPISMALSLTIEATQLIFRIGAFEVSDLIANSIGGVLGIMSCVTLEPFLKRAWNKLHTHN